MKEKDKIKNILKNKEQKMPHLDAKKLFDYDIKHNAKFDLPDRSNAKLNDSGETFYFKSNGAVTQFLGHNTTQPINIEFKGKNELLEQLKSIDSRMDRWTKYDETKTKKNSLVGQLATYSNSQANNVELYQQLSSYLTQTQEKLNELKVQEKQEEAAAEQTGAILEQWQSAKRAYMDHQKKVKAVEDAKSMLENGYEDRATTCIAQLRNELNRLNIATTEITQKLNAIDNNTGNAEKISELKRQRRDNETQMHHVNTNIAAETGKLKKIIGLAATKPIFDIKPYGLIGQFLHGVTAVIISSNLALAIKEHQSASCKLEKTKAAVEDSNSYLTAIKQCQTKMRKIPDMVRPSIAEEHQGTFDQCHAFDILTATIQGRQGTLRECLKKASSVYQKAFQIKKTQDFIDSNKTKPTVPRPTEDELNATYAIEDLIIRYTPTDTDTSIFDFSDKAPGYGWNFALTTLSSLAALSGLIKATLALRVWAILTLYNPFPMINLMIGASIILAGCGLYISYKVLQSFAKESYKNREIAKYCDTTQAVVATIVEEDCPPVAATTAVLHEHSCGNAGKTPAPSAPLAPEEEGLGPFGSSSSIFGRGVEAPTPPPSAPPLPDNNSGLGPFGGGSKQPT